MPYVPPETQLLRRVDGNQQRLCGLHMRKSLPTPALSKNPIMGIAGKDTTRPAYGKSTNGAKSRSITVLRPSAVAWAMA